MAAPASTVRQTPAGIKLDDGFPTKIAFARDPDVSLWEIGVTPPGIDGGDPIDTTTMHNVTWRTMSPRQLKTLTPFSFRAAYDPVVYTSIVELINEPGAITVHLPDGSKLDFYGFLQTFEPDEHAEGEFPEASCAICPTNYDPVNRVEAAPVLTSVAGT